MSFEPFNGMTPPNEWKARLVKDIAVVNERSIKKSDRIDTIQYIDIAAVNHRNIDQLQTFKLNDAPSRARRIVQDNDILISTVRPNLKHYTMIRKAEPDMIASTGFAVISPKRVHPDFLYYYLTSDSYTRYLTQIAEGQTSAYPAFNSDIIENTVIYLPPENEQCEIGEMLASVDKKIELNNAINKNLEEMAQALFKRWFVDFEFPNENGEPYKSSGGEFEESELGLIPRGWKVKKISEVTNIVRGASPRPIQDYIDSKGMPWIKISDATEANSKFIVKTKEFIKKAGISKSRKINPGTLILSNSATPGIPMFVLIEACVHDGWLIFKDFFGVSKEFLYYFLIREREGIVSLSNGSVFRNLKTDILKNYKIIIPKDSVLMQADVIFKSINESIASRIYQNEQLAELRDTLLPKLMSGEIRVPVEQDHSVPDLPMVAESSAIYQP